MFVFLSDCNKKTTGEKNNESEFTRDVTDRSLCLSMGLNSCLSSSPLPLLLQEVGELVTFVHVVSVLAFLRVQLLDGTTVALLSHQQLTQHPPVRLLVLLLQTLQLRSSKDAVRPSQALIDLKMSDIHELSPLTSATGF